MKLPRGKLMALTAHAFPQVEGQELNYRPLNFFIRVAFPIT
jgi:hypothetical protein